MPVYDCEHESERVVWLMLSGGVVLGMYEAGAYAALHERSDLRPTIYARHGSPVPSIGSVTATLIAGNPPERRITRLRGFWQARHPFPMLSSFIEPFVAGEIRQVRNKANTAQTLLLGRPGLFRP